MNLVRIAALVLVAPAVAWAGGNESPAPPAPPEVDVSTLPDSASQRPDNVDGSAHQALARLMADREVVAAGEPFRLGVELIPNEDWHSYWRAPGDVGMPLEITWQLPEGTTTTEPVFPIPQRFETSGIVSYGYSGPNMLFTEVVLPEGTSGTVELAAHVEWLVCEANCIPGEVHLVLPIEVAEAPGDPAPWASRFDHYAGQHPIALADTTAFAIEGAVSQTAFRAEDPFTAVFRIVPTSDAPVGLEAEVDTWPTFAPIFDQYQIFMDSVELAPTLDGGALIVMKGEVIEVDPLPESSVVGGLFQVEVGDVRVPVEYTTTFTWAERGAEVKESGSPLIALASGEPPADPPGTGGRESAPPPGEDGGMSVIGMVAFAFLGGVLLNVMPCVFPVLMLKLFGLVSIASAKPRKRILAGVAYTLGILVSFWVLAVVVIAVRATLGGAGWGFQFQSPVFVAVLGAIVFGFGLSLFGVFEIPVIGADAVTRATSGPSLANDFLYGVFATLLATPCTAPFMGSAVGFAFTQSDAMIFTVFTVIALGLAAPFMAVALVPTLLKVFPRPGAWMETFKQLLGFTLIATAVWLVSVLADQVSLSGTIGYLAFLMFVAAGGWVFGRWGGLEQSWQRQLVAAMAGIAIAAAGGLYFLDLEVAEAADCDTGETLTELSFADEIPWQPFTEARVEVLAGRPVFIDFTATWCLTCKVNEKGVLETEEVRTAMAERGVIPLEADWTKRDPVITSWLQRYGKAGVPFYLVIPADRTQPAIPLPEVLTTSIVIDALDAAASTAPETAAAGG